MSDRMSDHQSDSPTNRVTGRLTGRVDVQPTDRLSDPLTDQVTDGSALRPILDYRYLARVMVDQKYLCLGVHLLVHNPSMFGYGGC